VPDLDELKGVTSSTSLLDLDHDLLSVAPGLSEGMAFDRASSSTYADLSVLSTESVTSVLSFTSILQHGQIMDKYLMSHESNTQRSTEKNSETVLTEAEAEVLQERPLVETATETIRGTRREASRGTKRELGREPRLY